MGKMATTRKLSGILIATSLLSGCAGTGFMNPGSATAPPPSSPSSVPTTLTSSRANEPYAAETARVEQIGEKLLRANPQLGLKLRFVVKPSSAIELYHQGDNRLCVSLGLLQQCRSDAQLAAALALEMSNLVSERHGRAEAAAQTLDRDPPPADLRIGRDGGTFGDADQIGKAELAASGRDRRRPKHTPTPFDHLGTARQCLTKAGYPATELDGILALVEKEKQK
jgi:predicted Zn-dependent protease